MKILLLWLAAAMTAAASANADEKPVALTEAPGRQVAEENCGSCHSLDYLRTNAPFLDRKGWQAEINKMVNAFGAPIAPQEAETVVDYLAGNYSAGK